MDIEKFVKLIICVVIVGIVAYPFYVYNTVDEVTITVTEKLPKVSQGSYSYLIFSNNEVLELKDSWLHAQVRSSDVYARIEVGSVYKFKVYGWRIPFFSVYRVIIGYSKIE